MRTIFTIIFLLFFVLKSNAQSPTSCINGPAVFDILKNVTALNSVDRADVRVAYDKLIKSGIVAYETPRPYLYSVNLSFTSFTKRICHDQICDSGDFLGTLMKCFRATSESCVIIAATKEKDFYCFLNPLGWDFSKPYNPFGN